jgi:hypothetical protein
LTQPTRSARWLRWPGSPVSFSGSNGLGVKSSVRLFYFRKLQKIVQTCKIHIY